MKKLLVLMLALVMVFSLASCKSKCEKKGHLDDDGNLVCDRCDTKLTAPIPEHTVHTDADANGYCDGCDSLFISYGDNNVVGTVLRKSLEKQINEAQSVKLNFEYKKELVSETWDYYYDDDDNEIVYSTNYSDVTLNRAEVVVSRSTNGFNLKITNNYERTETTIYSDEEEVYTDTEKDSTVIYVIDGYVYDEIEDGFFVETSQIPAELKDILSELFSAKLVSSEKRNEMLDALGAEVAAVLNIRDGVGSFSVDMADSLNGLFNYLAALDFENDTVGSVLNDALALVSEDLTVDAIINELERLGGLTVNEGLAELDAWLTEEHGTTVQGIYDSLINNAELIETLEEIIVYTNELDADDPDDGAMLDEIMTSIKSFKLADYISAQELGDVRIYDFLNAMSNERLAEYEEFFEGLRSMMSLTLGEFDDALTNNRLALISMLASTVKVDALNAKLDLSFKNALELVGVNGSFNFATSRTSESVIEGKTDTFSDKLSVSFKIYDISEEPIAIALPESSEVISYMYVDNYFEMEDGSWFHVSGEKYDDEYYIDVFGGINLQNGTNLYFYAYGLTIDEITADVVVISDIEMEYRGVYFHLDETAEMKVVLDLENDSFTFVEIPEYTLPNEAHVAFYQYIENPEDTDYTFTGIEEAFVYSENEYFVRLNQEYPLTHFVFTVDYTVNDTESESEYYMLCTIVGFGNQSDYLIRNPIKGHSWYGGCYNTEEINIYFGGDPTFVIALDKESGEFYIVEYPMIEDDYKDDWPE